MFPPLLSMCMKTLNILTIMIQNVKLISSQDSNISTFSRSSVRSSKRLKGMGETGYTKPGPPTPGRNKSLGKSHHGYNIIRNQYFITSGNLSLPKDKINTSSTSLETTQTISGAPGVSSNTPDMSRVSAR